MAPHESKAHWEQIYGSKQDREISWFEPLPRVSLDFLLAGVLPKGAHILDVGGGSSRLAEALLEQGYNITVLDIAEAALQRSRNILKRHTEHVRWIAADIIHWQADTLYDAWHDRAVFHFLTSEQDRAAYRAALTSAIVPGGTVVLATFAPNGPERCSGLPVQRYSPETLAAELGDAFELQQSRLHDHTTPAGVLQHFQYSRFEKRYPQRHSHNAHNF